MVHHLFVRCGRNKVHGRLLQVDTPPPSPPPPRPLGRRKWRPMFCYVTVDVCSGDEKAVCFRGLYSRDEVTIEHASPRRPRARTKKKGIATPPRNCCTFNTIRNTISSSSPPARDDFYNQQLFLFRRTMLGRDGGREGDTNILLGTKYEYKYSILILEVL